MINVIATVAGTITVAIIYALVFIFVSEMYPEAAEKEPAQ